MTKLVEQVIREIKANPANARRVLVVLIEAGYVTKEDVRNYYDCKRLKQFNIHMFKNRKAA